MGMKLRAVVGLLALAIVGSNAGREMRAAAEQGMPRTPLAELVLPYSPYVFDLAVYAARSVAEVTYAERRYDPVIRSLVVTDLTVERGDFIARIGQLRVSSDRATFDEVAVDTRPLPLDETVRAVLRAIDKEIVTGSATIANIIDPATADYKLDAEIQIDNAGTLDVVADLAGLHVLAPIRAITPLSQTVLAGRLRSAHFEFSDEGLATALYNVIGGAQGLDPNQARAAAVLMAGIGLQSIVEDFRGAGASELKARAQKWSSSIQGFLKSPDRLTVSLDPETPFDLKRFNKGISADDVLALSPSVTTGPIPRLALVDPEKLSIDADSPVDVALPAAKAFIEGVGVPQDVARGLGLVMPAAIKGNRVATLLMARALMLDPGVNIDQDELSDAYVALLLARAEGLSIEDRSVSALRDRLSPGELAAGEEDALTRWTQTPRGAEQRRLELTAFKSRDWRAIRRLALAYYEGTSIPHNGMRAYGWATIAAAGGDRIAEELRNDLITAVNDGRLVLSIDRARAATRELWSALVAGQGAVEARDGALAPPLEPDGSVLPPLPSSHEKDEPPPMPEDDLADKPAAPRTPGQRP